MRGNCQVADALEVVGDFQRRHDQTHLVVGEGTAAQQANGMLVDHDFHFVDARLKEEDFAGERGGARAVEGGERVQGPIHGPFHGASHRDEVVDQRVVQHCFAESGRGARHELASVQKGIDNVLFHSPAKICGVGD